MIDYNKLKELLYNNPNLSDVEIAKQYVEIYPEILNEINLDTLRRKVNFLRELPSDFSMMPYSLVKLAFERYLLEKKIIKIQDIIEKFQISRPSLDEFVNYMRKMGYNIEETETHIILKPIVNDIQKIKMSNYDNGEFRCGFVTDTHLGSMYERLDLLHTMYDIFEREGIKIVFHGGNWIDGESKLNEFELKVRGIDGQINYFVDNYPFKKDIITYFISGDDHEGWWQQREGFRNLGYYAQLLREQQGKKDLVYLGYLERDIEIKRPDTGGSAIIRLAHGGKGSAYALSYQPQKIIESYINDKPNVLLLGHYHKYEDGWYRNVYYVQGGCFQDQTTYMRKRSIQAVLGGCIITLHQAPDGAINMASTRFYPFFDKHYYQLKGYYTL